MTGTVLCHRDDLTRTGAWDGEVEGTPVVVVEDSGIVRAYVNRCPHIGTPLNMLPHQVLDETREYLLCRTHGALFRKDTGLCVRGPCKGDALKPLAVTEDEERIIRLFLRTGA